MKPLMFATKTTLLGIVSIVYVLFVVHFFVAYFRNPSLGFQTDMQNFFTERHLLATPAYKKDHANFTSRDFVGGCQILIDGCEHSCPGSNAAVQLSSAPQRGFPFIVSDAYSFCPGLEEHPYPASDFTLAIVLDWTYLLVGTAITAFQVWVIWRWGRSVRLGK